MVDSKREEELDIVGSLFGLKFVPGGTPEGLVELYVEDDEWYHFKCVFNHFWLKDLKFVAEQALKKVEQKQDS